jgi:hypothetical protein
MAGLTNLVADLQACVCGAGPCATTCASEYCSNGTIATKGDPCDLCIGNSLVTPDGGMGACYTQVLGACSNNVDCTAYLACANGCPTTP